MRILTIERIDHESVRVLIEIDAKSWEFHKRNGMLGQLYGIDISNHVFRESGVKAMHPAVNDRNKASNGVKVLEFYYYDLGWQPMTNLIRGNFEAKPNTGMEYADNIILVDFKNKCRINAA